MQTLVIILYVAAMVLSVWGVIGPYRAADRLAKKADRAKAHARDLEMQQYSDDESIRTGALARYNAALEEPFEDGPEKLGDLSGAWVFKGGSVVTEARAEAKTRAQGLRWVIAGVCVASIASIISVCSS